MKGNHFNSQELHPSKYPHQYAAHCDGDSDCACITSHLEQKLEIFLHQDSQQNLNYYKGEELLLKEESASYKDLQQGSFHLSPLFNLQSQTEFWKEFFVTGPFSSIHKVI